MKSSEPNLRTGELNEFDRGFQTEMDLLIEKAYNALEQQVICFFNASTTNFFIVWSSKRL